MGRLGWPVLGHWAICLRTRAERPPSPGEATRPCPRAVSAPPSPPAPDSLSSRSGRGYTGLSLALRRERSPGIPTTPCIPTARHAPGPGVHEGASLLSVPSADPPQHRNATAGTGAHGAPTDPLKRGAGGGVSRANFARSAPAWVPHGLREMISSFLRVMTIPPRQVRRLSPFSRPPTCAAWWCFLGSCRTVSLIPRWPGARSERE